MLNFNACFFYLCFEMDRKIISTEDGSKTIFVKSLNESYHSSFGAINESSHIFIQNGLQYLAGENLKVLEIGFGTGLNAYLSLQNALNTSKKVSYLGIEKYPLVREEWEALNYTEIQKEIHSGEFEMLHRSAWDTWTRINNYFDFYKICADLRDFRWDGTFDLVYFDAFSPNVQPGLWSSEIFHKLYSYLEPGGILLTYSSRGMVKQNLIAAGFKISRLPGPKGKRHIIRALK